ncbi:hypothetical protein WJX84_011111 [Apatococcus fuscideae]|uniref:Adenosine deaminase domain-containing protein n=1 Tax=Apatococcus fuscideae TaxID=2026836 RepID=A0AAW1SRI4_9CHLO
MKTLPDLYNQEQLAFCQSLPKVELHAHLNGSVRASTLRELAAEKQIDPELCKLIEKGDRTLAECFGIFTLIHQVTTSISAIQRITREVLEDCAADNIIFAELRTTPKSRPEHGLTKQTYVEAVLAGIDAFSEQNSGMEVGLLLSIDRRESAEEAMHTVTLAQQYHSRGVSGLDLSGNPTLGSWTTWRPALDAARASGLHISLHAGEVYRPAETSQMLEWRPDRLGHMCCLDEQLRSSLLASHIPLELCLSSNVITESVAGYPDHHFRQLYHAGMLVAGLVEGVRVEPTEDSHS